MTKSWMLIWILSIVVGAIIGLMVPVQGQTSPYVVYETKGACIYASGYGSSPSIFVISKNKLLKNGSFGGC